MSQSKYTIQVAIDDTAVKDLERRLGGLMGGKNIGGGSSSGGTKDPVNNLMKLATIATGIGSLVLLVKKITDSIVNSSPMLQAMLKLFDTTIMFILRPIGDFIGFILKPIMIFVLRYIAIPFYKYFAPLAARYGTKIGDFFMHSVGPILEWFSKHADVAALVASAILGTGVIAVMWAIRGFLALISTTLSSILTKVGIVPPSADKITTDKATTDSSTTDKANAEKGSVKTYGEQTKTAYDPMSESSGGAGSTGRVGRGGAGDVLTKPGIAGENKLSALKRLLPKIAKFATRAAGPIGAVSMISMMGEQQAGETSVPSGFDAIKQIIDDLSHGTFGGTPIGQVQRSPLGAPGSVGTNNSNLNVTLNVDGKQLASVLLPHFYRGHLVNNQKGNRP